MSARRALVTALLLALAPTPAAANGRLPFSTSLAFRPGDDQTILVATTFGLLLSYDDGASFHWVCEDAIGYGGRYDPDYEITADGTIYVTAFDGLTRSQDNGCTWELVGGALADRFTNDVEIAADGTLWAVTATGMANNDAFVAADGVTFVPTGLLPAEALWKSVRVAPTDTQRVYVAGETTVMSTTVPHLRRSLTGGAAWEVLSVDVFGEAARLSIIGVSPVDPEVVFARVNGFEEDVIYRSPDGALSWVEVLRLPLSAEDNLAFTARADGMTYLAGGASVGARISIDGGLTWNPTAAQPQMACVGERSDGELFACGWNWDPDFFVIGRSDTGMSWDPVVRLIQIAGPLSCPAGTIQFDTCEALKWPDLRTMFGIGGADAGPVEVDAAPGSPDAGSGGDDKGCGGCGIGVAAVLLVLPRRRRRRSAL